MRNIVFLFLLLFCLVLPVQAQANPESAQALVTNVVKTATAEQRKALIAFHASWCGWCKRLENFLDLPEIKPVIDRYFEVMWLTVNEREGNKHLENPGADEFLSKWTNGVRSGIPFYVLLDSKEQLIASSIRAIEPGGNSGNIGFPGNDEERRAFIDFLKTGAPNMNASEEATLIKGLEAIMSK